MYKVISIDGNFKEVISTLTLRSSAETLVYDLNLLYPDRKYIIREGRLW